MFICSKCNSNASFRIEAQIGPNITATVNGEGEIMDHDGYDITWENDARITCLDCSYESEVYLFYPRDRNLDLEKKLLCLQTLLNELEIAAAYDDSIVKGDPKKEDAEEAVTEVRNSIINLFLEFGGVE